MASREIYIWRRWSTACDTRASQRALLRKMKAGRSSLGAYSTCGVRILKPRRRRTNNSYFVGGDQQSPILANYDVIDQKQLGIHRDRALLPCTELKSLVTCGDSRCHVNITSKLHLIPQDGHNLAHSTVVPNELALPNPAPRSPCHEPHPWSHRRFLQASSKRN